MTDDPIQRYLAALARASTSEPFDATCAALATTDARGRPSVRFVLVKEADAQGFVFFTNYESPKAHDLAANPWGALAWHWASTGEQVRAAGPVQTVSRERSRAYFATRPRGSQLGAWASRQSSPIASRGELETALAAEAARFQDRDVELPATWGGYLLIPKTVEFWTARDDRLHDRVLYAGGASGWQTSILSP